MIWLLVLLSILIIVAIVIFAVILLLKEKDTPRIFKKSRTSSDGEQADASSTSSASSSWRQFRSRPSTEAPPHTEKQGGNDSTAHSSEQPGQQWSSSAYSSSDAQPEVPPSDISLSGLSQDAAWLSIRTREYEQGIQVSYDAELDIISIIFTRCRPRTATEVALAIQILYEQTSRIIKERGQYRYGFIVDIAGLFIGESVQQAWQHTFKAFFNKLSKEVDTGIHQLCVYNSSEPTKSQEAIKKRSAEIRLMTPPTLYETQNSIFDTREEAIACLNRLKEVAASKA